MKISDIISEILFESSMESDIDEEVSWRSSIKDKIYGGYIPLTPTIVKKILGEAKKVESFHVTDETHIDDIKKIIGKRNSISSFKYFSDNFLEELTGIKTNGGVILKIEGILDFISSSDVFSTVDFSLNRRWISAELISRSMYHELQQKYATNSISSFIQQPIKLKEYLIFLYRLLDKYHEEISDNLINLIFSSPTFSGNWNELLVRNIKIKEIAWYPNTVYVECIGQDSDECKKLINDFKIKLRSVSPEKVYTFYKSEDVVEWFKRNGGHTDINLFKKEHLSNIDKNKLLKTEDGIKYLFDNDIEFIFNNIDSIKEKIEKNSALPIFILHSTKFENLDRVCKLLINIIGEKMDSNLVQAMLRHSLIPDELIELIIKVKNIKLDYNMLISFIRLSENPIRISELIGIGIINELISNLSSRDIESLVFRSKSPEEVKKLIDDLQSKKYFYGDHKIEENIKRIKQVMNLNESLLPATPELLIKSLPDELKQLLFKQWYTKQNPKWHPEGNSLKHILVVVKRSYYHFPDDPNMIMAALFHDLGKMDTYGINPKTGQPTAYGHEYKSVEYINRFSDWIKTFEGTNIDEIKYLVHNHMKVKPSTWDIMKEPKKEVIKSHPSFEKLIHFTNKLDGGGTHIKQ